MQWKIENIIMITIKYFQMNLIKKKSLSIYTKLKFSLSLSLSLSVSFSCSFIWKKYNLDYEPREW